MNRKALGLLGACLVATATMAGCFSPVRIVRYSIGEYAPTEKVELLPHAPDRPYECLAAFAISKYNTDLLRWIAKEARKIGADAVIKNGATDTGMSVGLHVGYGVVVSQSLDEQLFIAIRYLAHGEHPAPGGYPPQ